ncbi:MAG: hypothetical protein IT279_04115 [Ignavibacteriaceae bacterium]|nr:hypothetical protein [Ignavibacteriaceae bacterium]
MTLLNGINQLLLFVFLVMGIAVLSWHLTEKITGFFRRRKVKQNESNNRQTLQNHLTQMPMITQAPMQIPYYQQQAPQQPMMYDPAPPPPQGYYYEQHAAHAYEEQAQMARPPMRAFHTAEVITGEEGYDEVKKGNNYRDFIAKNFK